MVGAGLGENLYPAEAGLVALRRERVVVDAYLADRVLRGDAPALEAVNQNLAAVRPDRGAGERRERRGQLFGVVGQGFEVFALQHDRAGALVINVDRRLGGDRHLLLFERDAERDLAEVVATGADLHVRLLVGREARRGGAHGVGAGREAREQEVAFAVGRRGLLPAC